MKVVLAKETEFFKLNCKLSDDKLKLFLDLEPLKPKVLSRQELLEILKECIKSDLVDLGVLDDALSKFNANEKVSERRIAKGKEAAEGLDGKILLLVKKFTGAGEVKVDSKGIADYSDRHLFDNIKKDQVVGRLYPPKKGADGVTALGELIPSKPGKPLKPNLDKSVALQKSPNAADEFELLVAQNEGFLAEDGGKITIKSELVIDGDLDYHFGNLDFVGSVVIKGDANRGFRVRAEKGIDLRGCLNGAALVAPDGDIKIKGLARGAPGITVECGKEVHLVLAQELSVSAGSNIKIEKQALECTLRTAGSIISPMASLVGGESYAVCGVEVKYLGNQAGVTTNVILCSDVETSKEYVKLAAELLSHEKALQLLELHLGPLIQNPSRVQVLKEPHKSKMQQLLNKLAQVKSSQEKLLVKKQEILSTAHISSAVRVNVHGLMYEGASIRAAEEKFTPQTELKGPISIDYLAAEKRFQTGELKALECVPASLQDTSKNK